MLNDVKWIKITTDIFENIKIKSIRSTPKIGDKMVIVWLELLCLAGSCNNNGLLVTDSGIVFTDKLLATTINERSQFINICLKTFSDWKMIEISDEGVIKISNWLEYQNASKLEEIKRQGRDRQKKYREKTKNALRYSNVTGDVISNDFCSYSYSISNSISNDNNINNNINNNNINNNNYSEDKDIDLKEIKEKDLHKCKSKEKKRNPYFLPPTVEEVKAYCDERKNNVNPQAFIDFYESKGWMIGKNKMKDWKAAVRTWERKDSGNNGNKRNDKGYNYRDYYGESTVNIPINDMPFV